MSSDGNRILQFSITENLEIVCITGMEKRLEIKYRNLVFNKSILYPLVDLCKINGVYRLFVKRSKTELGQSPVNRNLSAFYNRPLVAAS